MRLVLWQYAAGRLGADPQRWALAVTRAKTCDGSIPELFAAGHSATGHSAAGTGKLDPSNILLALAARDVAAALHTETMAPAIVMAADYVRCAAP